ncbi:DedA family protein [Bacillus solitudinis]|uniref:DedA family protein n=1 Tax=Bacillus solitudinis TaxID=2014074 RepID=UPI0012FE00A0|nr:VTT domain-containing protein [Bacillus solitudinis]
MIEFILDLLKNLGWIGLFIGVGIEAISIPFPAALFVLVYGYILDPSLPKMLMLAIGSSIVYVSLSFIPYWLSIKYEPFLRKKLPKRKVRKVESWIEDYGVWMIAVGRILGMGYIAYIAGFSKIRPLSFGFFTFLGFFPVSLLLFYLGTLGDLEKATTWLQNAQWLIVSVIGVTLASYFAFRWFKRKETLVGKKEEG